MTVLQHKVHMYRVLSGCISVVDT